MGPWVCIWKVADGPDSLWIPTGSVHCWLVVIVVRSEVECLSKVKTVPSCGCDVCRLKDAVAGAILIIMLTERNVLSGSNRL